METTKGKTRGLKSTIMIVDDEEMVLRSLETYLQLETDLNILTFSSPYEALKAFDQSEVDLVIADFLMPEMDGLQFLKEIKKRDPDIPRILLTGYADKENAIKAINEIGIFQYIEKPWDNEYLKLVIKNGLENKSLRKVLQEKINELDQVLLERDRLAERDEFLQKELELAKKVQQKMLPQNIPFNSELIFEARYIPSLGIGGDFYDIISLSEDRVAILLADVTGHGIQAALSTMLLKSIFSSFEHKKLGPGEMLKQMNGALYKLLPQDIFVAALILTMNLTTGECQLANAGNPYPTFLRPAESLLKKMRSAALLLGVVDEQDYKTFSEFTFDFLPGDRIFLYTDGLTEVKHGQDKYFDCEILQSILLQNHRKSMKQQVDEIISAWKNSVPGGQVVDDLTIVAIERKT